MKNWIALAALVFAVQLVHAAGTTGLIAPVPTAVKTSAYTAAVDDLVPVDTTSGSVTITLPTAPANGSRITVSHVTRGGSNTVTIAAGGSDVFNKTGGATSLVLSLETSAVTLQYTASGAIWYPISALNCSVQ